MDCGIPLMTPSGILLCKQTMQNPERLFVNAFSVSGPGSTYIIMPAAVSTGVRQRGYTTTEMMLSH